MEQKVILHIEDNFHNRRIVRKVLTAHGYTIVEAEDGLSGLEMVRQLRPPLILLDIGLPGMNGYEVAHALRREMGHHNILLVALTGYGQEEDIQRAAEAGFDQHLIKPVSVEQLKTVLAHPKLMPR